MIIQLSEHFMSLKMRNLFFLSTEFYFIRKLEKKNFNNAKASFRLINGNFNNVMNDGKFFSYKSSLSSFNFKTKLIFQLLNI